MTSNLDDVSKSFSSKVRDELLSRLCSYHWSASAALTALAAFAVVALKDRDVRPLVMRVSRLETASLISSLVNDNGLGRAKIQNLGKRDQQIEIDLNGREWELFNFDFYAIVQNKHQSDWWLILAPLFLSAGSMADPAKRIYHLEIVPVSAEMNEQLYELLQILELPFRKTGKKGRSSVYLSSGDDIADFLRLSGAHLALLRFEEIRSELELLGTVQRQVNFDEANIERMTNAVERQIESIKLIDETVGLDSLPLHLAQTAQLRLQYPELSLVDLGELMSPPIGKSGMNHRMRRLRLLADKIIESREQR